MTAENSVKKTAGKAKKFSNPDPNAGLTRRTVHMGAEYHEAIAHAKDLGKPYTAGFLIRETLKRHMAGVVNTFKAARGG